MTRLNSRALNEIRALKFNYNFTSTPNGSVLIEAGKTQILCTASVLNSVPKWLNGSTQGWLTAEYAMLPGAVEGRKKREFDRRDGRSVEIQRLIGRALRAAIDLRSIPGMTLHIDCDVIQADGGTRCASICGAMMALQEAANDLQEKGLLKSWPIKHRIAAISVGTIDNQTFLDLDYSEDSKADVDMNVIATEKGELIEVQGTAEGSPFSLESHDELINLAMKGIKDIFKVMKPCANAY
jgi:ribonuclease PH